MKAIIPVAGQGTRLRPHTHTTPKVLLHVAGKPIVGHILDQLVTLGVSDLVMVVGYRGDMVQDYVNRHYDFQAEFVEQRELLGLGHAILQTREAVQEGPGLIVLGDTVFRANLDPVLNSKEALIGVKPVEDPRRFGIAELEGNRITRLVEKPDHPSSNLAIVGIYYLPEMSVLYEALERLIGSEKRTKGEFQLTDALQDLLDQGNIMHPLPVDGWLDCGKSETLLDTNRQLLITNSHHRQIDGTIVIDPVYIADSASVASSIIGPFVSIGENSRIERSMLRDTIVNKGATVMGAALDKSIIGENANVVGKMTRLNVGDSSEIEVASS